MKTRELILYISFIVMSIFLLAVSVDAVPITTCAELQNMTSGNNYTLSNDIDCTGVNFLPLCTFNNNCFTGIVDGNFSKIINLSITTYTGLYTSLIGSTNNNGATIKNIIFENVDIKCGGNYCSTVVGFANANTNIINVSVSGRIWNGGSRVASIVGQNAFGSLTLTNIKNTASVNGSAFYTGGIIGESSSSATFTDVYNLGTIKGSNTVGGICGSCSSVSADKVFSTGLVIGATSLGGVGGTGGSATNTFYDNTTSNQSTSSIGVGYPTSIMLNQSTYTTFDFTNTWGIQSGSYPFLLMFGAPCTELWTQYNSTCNGVNYTILYNDTANCGSTYLLPVDNGTIISCSNCTELWINDTTACNGVNYTIQYYDLFSCNTTNDLPVDNGTIVPCTIPINTSFCSDNLCLNPQYANETCCIVTPTIACSNYTYGVYDSTGALMTSGVMNVFNQVTESYFFYFTEDVGTYYIKVCDDSTRQIKIVEREQMLSTFDWTIILMGLLTVGSLVIGILYSRLFIFVAVILMSLLTGYLQYSGYPVIIIIGGYLMVLIFTTLAFFRKDEK